MSGGSDSLSLLILTAQWANANNIELFAATVDHALRSEAATEAAYVHELCQSQSIHHTTLTWAHQETRASQATARSARHRLLSNWAHDNDIGHLLLGHTQNDQIETFMMRTRAGSSWYGLAGLSGSAPSPIWPDGKDITLVRPLLHETRDDLMAFLTSMDVQWISDPTNEDIAYERVKMRQLAETLDTASRDKILNSIAKFKDMRCAEDAHLSAFVSSCVTAHADGSLVVDLRELHTAPKERAQRLLLYAGMCVSGAETPARSNSAAAILQSLSSCGSGSATFGDCWCAWGNEDLRLYRRPLGEARTTGAPKPHILTLSSDRPTLIWDNRFCIRLVDLSLSGEVMSWEHAHNAGHKHPARPDWLKDERARRTSPLLVDKRGETHLISADQQSKCYAFMQPLAYERLQTLFSTPS